MPPPDAACALGRTEAAVLLAGEEHRERIREWSMMRAHPVCTGRPPCTKAYHDVERFVELMHRHRRRQTSPRRARQRDDAVLEILENVERDL